MYAGVKMEEDLSTLVASFLSVREGNEAPAKESPSSHLPSTAAGEQGSEKLTPVSNANSESKILGLQMQLPPPAAVDTAVSFEPFDWYDNPLFYDIIFGVETDKEMRFLLAVYDEYALTNESAKIGNGETGRRKQKMNTAKQDHHHHLCVLEPACGSGRLLEAFARLGHSVTGYDCMPGAVRFATARLQDSDERGVWTAATGDSTLSAAAEAGAVRGNWRVFKDGMEAFCRGPGEGRCGYDMA